MASDNRKRKASNELSTNPHTTKARNRTAKMEGYELDIEQAKKADQAAITYHLRKVKLSAEWQAASEEDRIAMKNASQEATIHKRYILS